MKLLSLCVVNALVQVLDSNYEEQNAWPTTLTIYSSKRTIVVDWEAQHLNKYLGNMIFGKNKIENM